LVVSANTQYLKETKSEYGSKVMPTRKNTQKRVRPALAHLNELLDEALKETFPASDPVAINVELETPELKITTTPEFRVPPRSTR
jgi:hypothetical protein